MSHSSYDGYLQGRLSPGASLTRATTKPKSTSSYDLLIVYTTVQIDINIMQV